MSVYTHKCENCRSSFYTVGATDRHDLNGGESENDRRIRQLENGGVMRSQYNSRFCCEACAKEWQSKNPGKSTLDGGQKLFVFLFKCVAFFGVFRYIVTKRQIWLGAVEKCIGERLTSYLCMGFGVCALIAFFVLKFKGKKIQKASYRSLFNYFRWFLLTVGFGVFASASGTSNHGKVEETDAEMQQVQSENGSSPESGDAGGRNSEQVEMHE